MPYIMIFEHEVDDYDGCQTSMETDWDTFETYSSLIEAAGIVYSYDPKFKVVHIFSTDRCIAELCQADIEKERDRILAEREILKQRKIAEAAEDQRIRDHAHNVLEYQYYLKLKEKFENPKNNR
jgi:hypothetical protein